MSTSTKVLIGVGCLFLLLFVTCSGVFISKNNTCTKLEMGIKAQYDQNKNNYDNYFKKLKEACQVPDMYVNDLKKVYEGTMQGRYGKNGSKAIFQFIREHNPTFDSSLYKQIQQIIEAGRNNFESEQKILIDKKRNYEIILNTFPSNIIVNILGFPKIDLSIYSIITSDETERIFKEKKSDPIKLK